MNAGVEVVDKFLQKKKARHRGALFRIRLSAEA
jgi:hypothetical protein